jgi:glyoxylase-like metal-dependent hydrolase (beta-lactamase superfamily II)
MRRIEWRLAEVGYCLHPECSVMRSGRWQVCEFPSLVALLKHPERGWVLFDTGYSEHFFEATRCFPASLYRWVTPVRFDPRRALSVQLESFGVARTDIAAIVLSHFHADHVGGVLDFDDVPVYCSADGWSALHARSRLAALSVGLLAELAPRGIERRLRFFEGLPGPRASSYTDGFRQHDVFGDESLVAVALPGHAPGHYGLRFAAEDGADVLLVGDAAWSTRALREHRPPPAWSTAWLGDTRAYRDTFARLHALGSARPEIKIVPSHCGEWRP